MSKLNIRQTEEIKKRIFEVKKLLIHIDMNLCVLDANQLIGNIVSEEAEKTSVEMNLFKNNIQLVLIKYMNLLKSDNETSETA